MDEECLGQRVLGTRDIASGTRGDERKQLRVGFPRDAFDGSTRGIMAHGRFEMEEQLGAMNQSSSVRPQTFTICPLTPPALRDVQFRPQAPVAEA